MTVRRGRPSAGGPRSGAGDLGNDRRSALAMFDLAPAAVARLDGFVDLLLHWQRRINLIAPSTVMSLWTRHVADSLQLLDLVPAHGAAPAVFVDLGSGGGFPGMVIACAVAADSTVHLVESNLKKAAFLREAVRQTRAPGVVHAARIEAVAPLLTATRVDYVTARAVAPLPVLLDLIAPFVKRGAKALLLKGQDLDHELTESGKHWHIETETVPSRTSASGRILIVHGLRPASAQPVSAHPL
ncbi:MAG: 16S rRNA (guanine(527)-N(7))-methyltransferase RsmG [Bradyrhizobiaceae bacterium]|nr:16S rRNA (guanine(527)-N(7))-methyltransferase RsmG [Bradyrhizobiaceae bacterium]